MLTIQQIYNLAIQLGINSDLRGEEAVAQQLKRAKTQYEKLSKSEKDTFDQEQLVNPYADTRIVHGSPTTKVSRIMAGIDIDAAELLIAKHLSQENKIDAVISHHPSGQGLARLHDVMPMQAEILALYGIPINVAESLLELRISEVARGIGSANHFKTADAARNLNMPYMCLHTVTDNLVADFLKKEIAKHSFEYVSELMEFFQEIPEYQEAEKRGTGPKIFSGNPQRRVGKIAITEVTGGTEGSAKMYEVMAASGVGTVIGMHMSEEHKKEAEKAHINAIIAGHMSSDSIGLNLLLDELEKKGIEVVPCGGLIRISRTKKNAAKAR